MTAPRKVQIAMPSTGIEEWEALREPLETGWLTQGPKVREFEEAFAARHQVLHALATSNCTTALHLALLSLGVGPGDEVIIPSFTWVASANVACYVGATPVLADVDPSTFNLRPDEVRRFLTPRTKAIIAVHLFGRCADIDAIAAAAPGVPIVEDAACAVGATYRGRSAGGLGTLAAFSFHPRKIVSTGEGGMVTTNDPALAAKIDALRNHGASVPEDVRHQGPKPYLLPAFDVLGFNYRMTDLQGAVGTVQLRKLDRFLAERQLWAQWYRRELVSIPWLAPPPAEEGYGHSLQAFVCRVDESKSPMPRNAVMDVLAARGVATRPGTHAVHMLGYYRERFGYREESLPVSRDCDRLTLAIPLHNKMTADDYAYVVEALRSIR